MWQKYRERKMVLIKLPRLMNRLLFFGLLTRRDLRLSGELLFLKISFSALFRSSESTSVEWMDCWELEGKSQSRDDTRKRLESSSRNSIMVVTKWRISWHYYTVGWNKSISLKSPSLNTNFWGKWDFSWHISTHSSVKWSN